MNNWFNPSFNTCLRKLIRIDLMRIWIRIRIQHFFYLWIRIQVPMRIQIQIQGFEDQTLEKIYSWNFLYTFFWSKTAIYLSLGLPKGRPSYRRSLQPSKENIQQFKTWKFLYFFLFLWVIFDPLDPDPSTQINADPDPQPWCCPCIFHPALTLSSSVTRASTNPQKRTSSTSKHENSLLSSFHFWPPGSGSGFINSNPSGSTTLVLSLSISSCANSCFFCYLALHPHSPRAVPGAEASQVYRLHRPLDAHPLLKSLCIPSWQGVNKEVVANSVADP